VRAPSPLAAWHRAQTKIASNVDGPMRCMWAFWSTASGARVGARAGAHAGARAGARAGVGSSLHWNRDQALCDSELGWIGGKKPSHFLPHVGDEWVLSTPNGLCAFKHAWVEVR
jgi:hypothetical protein